MSSLTCKQSKVRTEKKRERRGEEEEKRKQNHRKIHMRQEDHQEKKEKSDDSFSSGSHSYIGRSTDITQNRNLPMVSFSLCVTLTRDAGFPTESVSAHFLREASQQRKENRFSSLSSIIMTPSPLLVFPSISSCRPSSVVVVVFLFLFVICPSSLRVKETAVILTSRSPDEIKLKSCPEKKVFSAEKSRGDL